MSVSVQETVYYHVGNGLTVTFAYNCQVPQASDLKVYVDDVLTTSGFTIAGLGSLTGGTITFAVAPANLVSIRIERQIELERSTDYQQNGDFLSKVVNPDFNRIWMALQQQYASIARSIRTPKIDAAPPVELPKASDRANKLLGFDANGQPTAYIPASASLASIFLMFASAIGSSLIGYIQAGLGAIFRTLQDRLRDMVSAKDFGAKCDGVTNDSAAVQLAVNYCLANGRDLYVPGVAMLDATVNVDRLVDSVGAAKYFTIRGGGFKVKTAIPMFSSTIAFSTAPVSQLLRFDGVSFESSDPAIAAYVLDNSKLLRVQFSGCSFWKIKCLLATIYTQSIYFFHCNIRAWQGIFFSSPTWTFDLKIHGCLAEGGYGQFLYLNRPQGTAITSNVIEGISTIGYFGAIQFFGSYSITISGNYMEGNGEFDIYMASSGVQRAIAITGNNFDSQLQWDESCRGCFSMGNIGQTIEPMHLVPPGADVVIQDTNLDGPVTDSENYARIPARKTTAGDVGIGTEVPRSRLHIYKAAAPKIILSDAGLGETYGACIQGSSVPGQGPELDLGFDLVGTFASYARFNYGGGFNVGRALATTAQNGHFSIPTSAGAPTATPGAVAAGTAVLQFDTVNNKLWVYNGTWKSVTVA